MTKLNKDKDVSEIRNSIIAFATTAYEQHKIHARFQETQRSWLLVAYLSMSGFVYGSILTNYVVEGEVPRHLIVASTSFLILHVGLGLLVGLAMAKVSREFRRHYRQGELIVERMVDQCDSKNDVLINILEACRLGTAGDQLGGLRRGLAKRFGMAAIHNYVVSTLVGADIAAIAILNHTQLVWVPAIFIVGVFFVAWGFLRFNRLMETVT